MGAGQSTDASSQTPSRALHVLRVTPSSPASQTSIEPFFDFVVGHQGDNFSANKTVDAGQLEKIVEGHEGRTLNLLVWNSKSQQTRGVYMFVVVLIAIIIDDLSVVPITPSRDWSLPQSNIPDPQEPEAERKPSLLGLSMRMCEPEFALDNVWHVLDVLEGSPAESAGLVPFGDWIIGWSGGVLSAEGDFYDVVEAVRSLHEKNMIQSFSRPCSMLKNRYECLCIHLTSSTYADTKCRSHADARTVRSERWYLFQIDIGAVKGY